MYSIITFVLIVISVGNSVADIKNELKITKAFDYDLYERVLDPQKCEEQLDYIRNNFAVAMQFIDSSAKIPKGLLTGNLVDLGTYHQCLDIDHRTDKLNIEGKYCRINIPLEQDASLTSIASPTFPYMDNVWPALSSDTVGDVHRYMNLNELSKIMLDQEDLLSRSINITTNQNYTLAISLGICVPKVCRSKEVLDPLNSLNLTYEEEFCRLPNDKPISIADYFAIVIFGIIIILTIISTSYDVYHTHILKTDRSEINTIYSCFSIYTNTVKLVSLNKLPGALDCIDGIRSISTLWIIAGHSYHFTFAVPMTNLYILFSWIGSFVNIWTNSAPIAVDTFFLISGILCVYTVVGKFNKWQFIKSIHIFYLNRLLRIFPLLATVVLLSASVLHRVSDGPLWTRVGVETELCRERWWTTLLHVQNYVKPERMCLGVSWYLSVDTQLYLFSPLIIIWLFGSTAVALGVFAIFILISLVITTAYSFTYKFHAVSLNPIQDTGDFFNVYYINTLTRASAFIIGMAYGYILLKFKGKKLRLQKSLVLLTWILALFLMAVCVCIIYPILQPDYTIGLLDYFINSYKSAIWALAVGWMIFACVHGYGGPVNWFLTLDMWKLPARLSYAMYLIHSPLITIANSSMTTDYFFSNANTLYRFCGDLVFTILASFVLCIVIDSPLSTLFNLMLQKVSGKSKRPENHNTAPQARIVEAEGNDDKINKVT